MTQSTKEKLILMIRLRGAWYKVFLPSRTFFTHDVFMPYLSTSIAMSVFKLSFQSLETRWKQIFKKILKQSLNIDWSKCSRFSSKNDLS